VSAFTANLEGSAVVVVSVAVVIMSKMLSYINK
jgi:hypothetical protein